MSCCGPKRAEAMGQATSTASRAMMHSPKAAVRSMLAMPWKAPAGLVRVRYLESVPVAVNGPYTGTRYLFSKVNPVLEIDSRDAESLLSTRYFRRES